jgi:hypothetical protein
MARLTFKKQSVPLRLPENKAGRFAYLALTLPQKLTLTPPVTALES